MFVITALIAIFAGCGDRPPLPKLKADKTEIPVFLGSYTKTSFGRTVNADGPGPDYMLKDVAPTKIKAGTELRITFNDKPSKLVWSLWKDTNGGYPKEEDVNSGKLKLPDETGVYKYGLRAEWGKHNGASYAFAVEVE